MTPDEHYKLPSGVLWHPVSLFHEIRITASREGKWEICRCEEEI